MYFLVKFKKMSDIERSFLSVRAFILVNNYKIIKKCVKITTNLKKIEKLQEIKKNRLITGTGKI